MVKSIRILHAVSYRTDLTLGKSCVTVLSSHFSGNRINHELADPTERARSSTTLAFLLAAVVGRVFPNFLKVESDLSPIAAEYWPR
jgi:hypothetical protein